MLLYVMSRAPLILLSIVLTLVPLSAGCLATDDGASPQPDRGALEDGGGDATVDLLDDAGVDRADGGPDGALAVCGDGEAGLGEVCDADDLADRTCESLGLGGGTLRCASDCAALDTSGCDLACAGGHVHGDHLGLVFRVRPPR